MSNLIHTETVDDLGLIYLKDEGVAGIHIKGLAKLLGCNPGTIYGAMNAGVRRSDFIEVDMPTAGGIQGVRFILEPGVISILKYIRRGNFKPENKEAAEVLYDRFAVAGFKLYAMLQVSPESLQEMIPPSVDSELDVQPESNEVKPFTLIETQVAMAMNLAGGPGEFAVKALELILNGGRSTAPRLPPAAEKPPLRAADSATDNLCDAIVNYLSRRTNRQSDWNSISRGVSVLRPEPGTPKNCRLNGKGTVMRLLKRIEDRGQGRWITPAIFQLYD